MQSVKRQRNVQQHFVPASYLSGFTPDGTSDTQLYVYERNSDRVFRQRPQQAAKRRNWYSIPTTSGGFDDQVDVMITALEGQAMPTVRKLLARDYDLSNFERALLAHLISFQEFRTPWERANLRKIELSVTESLWRAALNTPGRLERLIEERKAKDQDYGSVSADQIRDAFKHGRIKLLPQTHAGIKLMVSTSRSIANIYIQMRWTVVHASDGQFLTSDVPVIRYNPEPSQGFFGRALMSPTAQVWFPLSKQTCLVLSHDPAKTSKLDELLAAQDIKGAEALTAQLLPINDGEVPRVAVDAINTRTILYAERFVYSPFESDDISKKFIGECFNLRITSSGSGTKHSTA